MFATVFTVGGIKYSTLNASTVQVTYSIYSGSITIPSNVTYNNVSYSVIYIGDDAFQGCGGLTSITIPSSVISIGTSAFYGCTGLKSITIPSSVITIRDNAFANCTGLINIDDNNPNYTSLDGIFYIKTMTILIQCPISKTGNITIPSSVTTISGSAFYGCKFLTNITIPSSVTSIGGAAFSGCTGLTSINIPSSITSIVDYTFYCCAGLTSLIIPSSVTSIGYSAFQYCTGLTNITIPSSITSIVDFAFSGCMGLASITIPSSVTLIGSSAFDGCTGLSSIYTYANVPVNLTYSFSIFYNVNITTCTLYVPKGSLSAYKAAVQWKDFVNIVEFDASAVNTPNENKLKVFYNSATGSLQLNGLDSPVSVSVYDLNGHLCLSRTVRAGETLPVQLLPRGIYVVKAVLNNEVVSRKVVI